MIALKSKSSGGATIRVLKGILSVCLMAMIISVATGCSKSATPPATPPGESDGAAGPGPSGASQPGQTEMPAQDAQRQVDSLKKRVELLEASIAPSTPRAAAEAWATGIKTRNGALIFAVLAPEARELEKSQMESVNWVTGVSSPWVEKFRIIRETKVTDTKWDYEIQFSTASSAGQEAPFTNWIVVERHGDSWYVAEVAPAVK